MTSADWIIILIVLVIILLGWGYKAHKDLQDNEEVIKSMRNDLFNPPLDDNDDNF